MDPRARDARAAELGGEPARQGVRTAEEDLAPPQVRDEPAQYRGVERDALARADELVQPPAAAADLLGHLVAQDELLAR